MVERPYPNPYPDVSIVKLNATGTALEYTAFLWGRAMSRPRALPWMRRTDVTGYTSSFDFPTTPGAFDSDVQRHLGWFRRQAECCGHPRGQHVSWEGRTLSRARASRWMRQAVRDVTGYTQSTDFPTTPGAFDTTANGGDDLFVVRLNAIGTSLEYSTYVGGASHDRGSSIAVDAAGSVYVTGSPNPPISRHHRVASTRRRMAVTTFSSSNRTPPARVSTTAHIWVGL